MKIKFHLNYQIIVLKLSQNEHSFFVENNFLGEHFNGILIVYKRNIVSEVKFKNLKNPENYIWLKVYYFMGNSKVRIKKKRCEFTFLN